MFWRSHSTFHESLQSTRFGDIDNKRVSTRFQNSEYFQRCLRLLFDCREVVERTRSSAGGRVVSLLEGGYNPQELGRCVTAHLKALADAAEGTTDP